MVENREKHRQNSNLIIHCPMSGASERANGRASGPVLTSVFFSIFDHSVREASLDGDVSTVDHPLSHKTRARWSAYQTYLLPLRLRPFVALLSVRVGATELRYLCVCSVWIMWFRGQLLVLKNKRMRPLQRVFIRNALIFH